MKERISTKKAVFLVVICLFMLLFTMQSSLGVDTQYNSTFMEFESTFSSANARAFHFNTSYDNITLNNFYLDSSSGATAWILYNISGSSSLATGGFTGTKSDDINIKLKKGVTYCIATDKGGASYSGVFNQTLSFPNTDTYITYITSKYHASSKVTACTSGTTNVPQRWNVNNLEITLTTPSPPVSGDTYWKINVADLYDDSNLSGVTVTFDTGCSNTTDANGFAQVTNNTAGCSGLSGTLTNVTITRTNWFANQTAYTIPENGTDNAGMYQKQININVYEKITNNSFSGAFNITTGGDKTYANGTDIYAFIGDDNYTFSANGWYNKTDVLSVSQIGIPTGGYKIYNVTNNRYNFTAISYVGGAITNFTIIATNDNYSYSQNFTTTNGTAIAELLQGLYYNFTIDAYGYVLQNVTLEANATSQSYEFTLYVMNTFNISIYDETNNSMITDHNFTVIFISDDYSSNTTYNGSPLLLELLIPSDYEIRYYEEGDNITYSVPKSYFVTLENRSYEQLRLYHVPTSISGYYIPVVLTDSGYYAQGAIIKSYRGYIEGNALVGRVVEMAKTDPNGQAVFRIVPNDVFYKFTGTSSDGLQSFQTNYFKITQETHTFQLSSGGLLTSITLANSNPYELEYLTATDTFRLTWDDDTNKITSGCLKINKYSRTSGETTVLNTCSDGASGSIVYMVTDKNETRYDAWATINTNTQYSKLTDFLSQSFTTSYQVWGLIGVFLTMIVFLFTVNLASTTEGVVINGVLTLIFMGLIGIFAVEWSSIVGIVIVAGVIIYKTRT